MTAPLRGVCIDPATGAWSDPVATPLLGALMQAVMDLYDSAPNADPPCEWGIVAGNQVNVERGAFVDKGCAGQLTVRQVSTTPAEEFPNTTGGPIREFDLSYSVHVEVGVWRPSPEPTDTGDGLVLPDPAAEQAAAEQVNLDAAIVRSALLHYAETTDTPIVLETYLPWGPEGGVVGGATTAQFQIV